MTGSTSRLDGYVFDTDVLSNALRRGSPSRIRERFGRLPIDLQFTTSISIGELVYGAFIHPTRTGELLAAIDDFVTRNLRVLAFDEAAAHRYGEVRAELEARGEPIGDSDTRIAAIALVHNLTLVTGNIRHFERVPGLRLVNWLA